MTFLPPPAPMLAPAPKTTSGLSITAFVLAFVAAPFGIILGIVALVIDAPRSDRTRGLSIAAIIVGVVVIGMAVVIALVWFVWSAVTGVMCGELAGGCPDGNPF